MPRKIILHMVVHIHTGETQVKRKKSKVGFLASHLCDKICGMILGRTSCPLFGPVSSAVK